MAAFIYLLLFFGSGSFDHHRSLPQIVPMNAAHLQTCPNCKHPKSSLPYCANCGIKCKDELWSNRSYVFDDTMQGHCFAVVKFDFQLQLSKEKATTVALFRTYEKARAMQQEMHKAYWTSLLKEGVRNDAFFYYEPILKAKGIDTAGEVTEALVEKLIDTIESGTYFEPNTGTEARFRNVLELVEIHVIEDTGSSESQERLLAVESHFSYGEQYQNTDHQSGIPIIAYAADDVEGIAKAEVVAFKKTVLKTRPIFNLNWNLHWQSIVEFTPEMSDRLETELLKNDVNPHHLVDPQSISKFRKIAEEVAHSKFVVMVQSQKISIE